MKNSSIKLYCFSPPIILGTFIVELIFALYTFAIYAKKSLFGKLAGLFLFCLAFFQLSEFLICFDIQSNLWARLGYIAITFLPPLGLHLISLITYRSRLIIFSYISALVLSLIIAFTPDLFYVVSCTGKFVAFTTETLFSQVYAIYYIGFLGVGLVQLAFSLLHNKYSHYLVGWFLTAYLSFMLPMAVIHYLVVSARVAVPSIMCGFALLAAIIVFSKILPGYHAKLKKNSR